MNVNFYSKLLGQLFAKVSIMCLIIVGIATSSYAQTTLIDPTGDGGFNNGSTFAANGWTVANYSGSVNQWVVGTSTTTGMISPFAGNKAYISSDGGVTNGYSTSASTKVYFYRDVTIPAGSVYIPLSFNWISNGEASWDMIQVYVAPTSVLPVGGTHPGSGTAGPIPSDLTGATQIGFFQSATTVQTATIVIPASFAGQTVRIIFMWKSDTSGGTVPGGSVDNISLTASNTVPTFTANSLGGLWSSPATWAGGVVPSGVNVVIPAGSIVTVDQVTSANNINIDGTLQWNGTSNAMTALGNITIGNTGTFLPYTTGQTGQTINIGGDFINNGFANCAAASTLLNFNGSQQGGSMAQTLGGTGSFAGDGVRGIIRTLAFQTTGSSTISTTQPLTATNGFTHTAGSLNTNGLLKIDNTAQVYGQALNLQVASVAVTSMGSAITAAPVSFGTAVSPWVASGAATANTRYFTGNNVYLCTTAGTFGSTAPANTTPATEANGTATVLWIGTLGTLGNPFQVTAVTAGTQYFCGNNLYTCIVAGTPTAGTAPTCTSGTCVSGTATFRYIGSPAKVTVNYDATTQTVRSVNLTTGGNGYSSSPSLVWSIGAIGATGTLPSSSVVYFQQIIGPASSLTQKSGVAGISGGITINSDQGASTLTSDPQSSSGVGQLSTSNGGVNYTNPPLVGFTGPTAINLITNQGSGYTTAPTITLTGGNLVSGTALTTSSFTITMNQGKIVSVYLSAPGTACYSTPPTLGLSSSLGGAAIAWPANCWPAATANIGTNGQLTSFTVTNSGYGYVAAPTVGIGTTSGSAGSNGGTFTTVATAPTARIALYNLTLNFFTPATSAVVNPDDASIPASRKLNVLSLAGNGNGLNLTSNLTVFGSSTPLSLTASASTPGNILNMGGNTLIFTWNGYAGTTGTFGSTNAYISNGGMTLYGRGGASTFNYPFDATFTWFAGSTPTAVTTGNTAQRVTVRSAGAPTGSVSPSGNPAGTRAYRVIADGGIYGSAIFGTNPTVTMRFNSIDALGMTQQYLTIGDATSLSGLWTIRSAAFGVSGPLPATGSLATATVSPGPIVPTGDNYYAWINTAPTPVITTFTPANYCSGGGETVTLTGSGFTGASAVLFNGQNAASFVVNNDNSITAVTPAGLTAGVISVINASITGNSTSYTVATTGTLTGTLSPSNGLICTTGGSVNISINDISADSYTWSPATGLNTTTGLSVIASPSVTTQYTVTAAYNSLGCNVVKTFNIGVISGSAVTPSTNPTTTCYPGGASTIQLNSNLSAGNFGVSSIAYTTITPPVGATALVTNGTLNVPLSGGGQDDGGWSGIPIGFTYNFFGTNFTTISAGTNGLLKFGAVSCYTTTAGCLGQFTFNAFPSTGNPDNIIALMAADLYTFGGTIKYWNDGIAPTRRFLIQYSAVPFCCSTGNPTISATAVLYETSGIVEIYIANASNDGSHNKFVALQNAGATIGAAAPGRNGGLWAASNEAWRFSPPANYTYAWSPSTGLDNTTASSVNYTVSGTGSFTYNLAVTNPSTGCVTNAPVNFTVVTAPAAPSISPSVSQSVNAGTPYSFTASGDPGSIFNWYDAATGGTLLFTGATYSGNAPCSGTYSAWVEANNGSCAGSRVQVTLNVIPITAPTVTGGSTVCGDGTVTLQATSDPGTNINWFANPTGGASLGTGTSFTTPVITSTTTFYAEASSGAGTQTGLGNTSVPPSSGYNAQRGIQFNAFQDFTLVSAQYYAAYQGTTNLTVQLQNSAGVVLQSTTLNIVHPDATPSWHTMNLNFPVTAGTGYKLLCQFNSGSLSNYSHSTGADYTSSAFNNLGSVGVITNGLDFGPVVSSTSYWYFYNITIAAGCSSARVPVTAAYTPPPSISVASTNSTLCVGSSAVISVSSSNPGYTYTWTSNPVGFNQVGAGPFTVSPTASTTYSVTANDPSSSCVASGSVTITTTPNNLTASASASPSSVCLGGNSQLNVVATSATGVDAYSFSASSGTFTPISGATSAVLSTGSLDDGLFNTITLPFSFNYGGTSYTQVTPSTNGTLFLGASGTTTTVNSLSSNTPRPFLAPLSDDMDAVSATLSYVTTGAVGSRVFTFEWLNMEWYYSVSGGPTISYQCRLYEGTGRIEFIYRQESGALNGSEGASIGLAGVNSGNFLSLNNSSAAPTASSSTETTSINVKPATGQIYAFMPPVASSLSYAWSPATFLNSTTIANPVVQNATSSQTYTVVVTNSNGCSVSASTAFAVATTALTNSTIALGSGSICSGNNFTASVSPTGGGSPYTYQWSDGIGGVYPNNPSITANLAAGTYSFTCLVTDPCGNSATAFQPVTVNLTPVVTATPASSTYCSNGAPVTLTASGANTYSWSPSTGLSSTTGSSVNASPTSATLYTVIGSTASGCTASASASVNYSVGPTASASVSPTAVCPGDLVNLTGSGMLASGGNYTVSAISYAPVTSSSTTAGPAGDDVLSSGITLPWPFTFYGTAYNTVYISTNGFLTFNSGMGAACCSGSVIPTAGSPYIALDWEDLNTGSGGNIDYFSLTSPNRFVIRWNNVSVYTGGGGTGSCDGQIILYDNGMIEIHNTSITTSYTTQTQGINEGGGTFGTAVSGRNSVIGWTAVNDAWRFTPPSATLGYAWTASPSAAINNATSANATANPTANTTYTLSVTGNGCTTTATAQVTMNSAPVTISASSTSVCQNGSSITLSSNFDGPYATYSGIGVTGNTFNPSAAGVVVGNNPVTVTYTPPTGCSGTATVNINVLAVPNAIASVSGANPRCRDLATGLVATGGGTYLWTGPLGFTSSVATPIISAVNANPAHSGLYTVTVTGTNGCVAQTSVNVVWWDKPTVTASATNSPVCEGNTINLVGGVNWNGETPSSTPFQWLDADGNFFPGNNAQNPSYSPMDKELAGEWTFKATTNHGCFRTSTVQVDVLAAPYFTSGPAANSIAATGNSDANLCSKSNVTYTPVGANALLYHLYNYDSDAEEVLDDDHEDYPVDLTYNFSNATTASGSGDGNGSTFNVGTTNVVVTASTDVSGCASTLPFNVVIIDNQVPVITATGDNTALSCNPSASTINAALGTATASDNCSVGTPTFVDSPVSADGCDRCQTRTWNVTDAHGNAAVPVSRTVCWIEDHSTPEIIVESTVADLGCNPSSGDIDYYLGTAVLASNTVLPGYCNHNSISVTTGPVTNIGCSYQQTRYWVATNSCSGNTSTASHTVNWIVDTQAPVISSIPANVTVSCAADVPAVNDNAVVATDNCSSTLRITHDADVVTAGSCANRFTITRTYYAADNCGNTSSRTQTITVNDQTAPVFSGCPANIVLAACTPTATWTAPTASDNCAGSATVTQTAGPASGSTFANGTTTTITYTAVDGCGNSSTCSFTVTRRAVLSCNAGPNENTYFGYTADQTFTHNATVTGGHAPYNYSWTFTRLTGASLTPLPASTGGLRCNNVTSSGDEVFNVIGSPLTYSNSYWTCSGVSTANYIAPAYPVVSGPNATSIQLMLLDTAQVSLTVTDADGCSTTCSFVVFSEDARCWAGNSSIQKVTICHRNSNNTCATICVDSSAVAAHLAHGDAVGQCPRSGCPTGGKVDEQAANMDASYLTAYPNPFNEKTTIAFSVPKDGRAIIRIYDALGKEIGVLFDGMAKSGQMYKVEFDGSRYEEGMYFYSITSDDMNQTKRMNLIK